MFKSTPLRVPRVAEEKLVASTRRSLSTFKGQQRYFPITNELFTFRRHLPHRKPSEDELLKDLPDPFDKAPFSAYAPLIPTDLVGEEQNRNYVTYYWKRDRVRFRELFSWIIPQDWGDYDTVSLGKWFRSVMMTMAWVWYAQRQNPMWKKKWEGKGISLRAGELYRINQDSIIFVNRDLLKTIYDEKDPTGAASFEFDRVLKSLYGLSCSVFQQTESGKWEGTGYDRVIRRLILGTSMNPQVRIVELSPRYHCKPQFLAGPFELKDRPAPGGKTPPYTNTTIPDLQLDRVLSLEELLLYEWYFAKGGGSKSKLKYVWKVGEFYREVLRKSARWIHTMSSSGKLRVHLEDLRRGLNKKLEKVGAPQRIGKFELFLKQAKYERATSRRLQFTYGKTLDWSAFEY